MQSLTSRLLVEKSKRLRARAATLSAQLMLNARRFETLRDRALYNALLARSERQEYLAILIDMDAR